MYEIATPTVDVNGL